MKYAEGLPYPIIVAQLPNWAFALCMPTPKQSVQMIAPYPISPEKSDILV